ncbi:rod shape-determining protein MreC [Wenzhouxiangella marina]|uniref:Cell shape-determining protein MreC n=1 Tax=Wenzhouxiangella marina TaxID=1579979 RepID=A0A0K0XSL4_9GAMM|nr:rod shape-determining protein MreC [Wenzhouxiangella marina]AKS40616.1 Cell shape-determining protein MreC [Wenzhouxiangella marina]MBB6088384.1 rod shape-determining protein MreC [Wenzhouxiangella marina]
MGDSGFGTDLSGRITRLMVYIVLCLVLMTLDFRGRWVEQVRDRAEFAVEPFWLAAEAPAKLGRWLHDRWRDRNELLAERERLSRELDESRAALLLLDDLRQENQRLRELLDASLAVERDYQTVELRQLDLNPYSHRLLVDRGASEGLRVGQPVMDANGLVGQVDRVLTHGGSVILLSDPDHALPVEIERSRLRTIAYGTGNNDELRLSDLPMNADVQVGDVLLTSGLGGRFPPGLPVADVIEVSRSSGEAFATATARMRAQLAGARHLLIVTEPPGGDAPEVEPESGSADVPRPETEANSETAAGADEGEAS